MKKSLKDLLGEQENNTIVTTRKGEAKVLKITDKEAEELRKDNNIQSIETTAGNKIKESDSSQIDFFPITVNIPEELPNKTHTLRRLKYEAQSLVDDSFINLEKDSISVNFTRKPDGDSFVEYARILGVPEEYIDKNADISVDQESSKEEEIFYEYLSDANGNEVFLNDIVKVGKKNFRITEGKSNKAYISSMNGKNLIEVGSKKGHTLLRNSLKLEKDKQLSEGFKKKISTLVNDCLVEVLREQAVLQTSSQEILGKFPTLKKTLSTLLTSEFDSFVGQIDWVAPKPTTFRIVLQNSDYFFLKWLGKGFEAQIAGKKYYLDSLPEYQQALDKINELLRFEPIGVDKQSSEPGTDAPGGDAGGFDDGGFDDMGVGGDGGLGGGFDTSADPTEPEIEGGDEVEFEEPAEEPEV